MLSENEVRLIGNIGSPPEMGKGTETPVCNFTVCTNKSWKGKDGSKHEKATWHRIVVWGEQGENCFKYLVKGQQVLIKGEIDNRSYEDKEGRTIYVSEVVANRFGGVTFGSKPSSEGKSSGGKEPEPEDPGFSNNDPDADIPF